MAKSVIYLHGFASSPQARKGAILRELFPDDHYTVPDLNAPTFETMTLTAIIERIAETVRACPAGDVYLIGSSFGGLASVHFLARFPDEAKRVKKLVLLAPALDYMANRIDDMGEDGLQQWKEKGHITVSHYAYENDLKLHYGIVEDAKQYDSYALSLDLPILIYHGKQDDVVKPDQSVRFANNKQNITLHLVDADHGLFDAIDIIKAGVKTFIG